MAITNQETLGRRIARMRLKHGMTQERLANIANVSAQAVSKWENDQSYPDIMLLPLLAKTFGVTVDELLGVEDKTAEEAVPTEPEPAVEVEIEPETMPLPVVEQPSQDRFEAEPKAEPAPVVEEAPAPETEEAPASEPEPLPEDNIDLPATRLRLHVIQGERDAVNIAIPLAAARFLSNIAGYMPDRLTEGVDLASFVEGIRNAGKGTLVNADDGHDRVIITLE